MNGGGGAAAGGHRLDGRVEAGGRGVAAGEHAGAVGHAGLAVDADLAALVPTPSQPVRKSSTMAWPTAKITLSVASSKREPSISHRLAPARLIGLAELAAHQRHGGDVAGVVGRDPGGLHEELDLEPFVASLIELGHVGRHLDLGAAVDYGDVGLASGGDLQADGAARGVEGDVAAADHDDLLADRDRPLEVELTQELDRVLHAGQLGAGQLDGRRCAAGRWPGTRR